METPRLHRIRKLETPILLDACLMALMAALASDAAVYLVHGDIQWFPWYWRAIVPTRLAVIFLAALCGLAVGRLLWISSPARFALALALGLIGSALTPTPAIN